MGYDLIGRVCFKSYYRWLFFLFFFSSLPHIAPFLRGLCFSFDYILFSLIFLYCHYGHIFWCCVIYNIFFFLSFNLNTKCQLLQECILRYNVIIRVLGFELHVLVIKVFLVATDGWKIDFFSRNSSVAMNIYKRK